MASHPFLKTVHHLFSCMIFSLQVDPSLAMLIIAFWMLVEEDGHVSFLEYLNSPDNHHLGDFIPYAQNLCVQILHLESRGINTRSGFQRRVIEGIDFYLNNVCYEAVGDLLDQFEIEESIHQADEDFLKEHVHLKMELPHQQDTTSNEARTLFVYFSDGHPMREDELFDYFVWSFGDVEEIVTEEPNPLSALVTFSSPDTLLRALGGEKTGKFIINGKYAWGINVFSGNKGPTSP